MSKFTKWKFEKSKVKVVFRLQFHATHIPQSGWDKLFISFIPAESGKATAKTTKANVRNGTCKWADPIYETTRLLQDIKNKQYDGKLYKLVLAMGSSRSSVLGEATINLADYADALKPSVIALPLHGCDSGTILHVTVQLLTSKTGFREFEQQRERGLQNSQNSPDESSGGKVSSTEENIYDQMDKASARIRLRGKSKDLAGLEHETGPNEDCADSGVGFDGSSNTSESLYAEKHDTSSAHEIDSLKSTVSADLGGLSLGQNPQLEKGDASEHRFLGQGTSDWVHAWSSDYSADNDLAAAYEENNRLRGSLEEAETSILELKQEISSLQNHADEIGSDAQNFSKLLAVEIASGEEMAKVVSVLRSECSKLKDDLEQFKVSKSCDPFTSKKVLEAAQNQIFRELQLRWLKGLLVVEDKVRELQNKACLGYNEKELRFLHADLEPLLSALQNLKQKTGLTNSSINLVPTEGARLKELGETNFNKREQFVSGTGLDVDLYQPLGMLHCLNIPGLVSHESDSVDASSAMKSKIFELLRELDESKTERESLSKKMDQMECYYEALVQELEENQRQMLGELQNLRNEHSTCLYAVSSAKAEMETVHQSMNDQLLRLAEEKQDVDALNKELERRAITAEAALKRARLNYSIAVDQLQKDLEVLSFQVSSMFETNDNLIRQAFADSPQLNFDGYQDTAASLKFNSREFDAAKLLQSENHCIAGKKQQLGGDILLDDLKRSLHLQEGLYRKVEEEVSEMHFVNLYLDVYSKALKETLLEASDDVKFLKGKMHNLMQQLELSTKSEELLMQKLQIATDDNRALNEYKAICTSECNDLAEQNRILGTNLEAITRENDLLVQKIAEWESLLVQYRSYESIYESCSEEKAELASLLEKKTLENVSHQNEIFSLQEQLKTVRAECDGLVSLKEDLQNTVNLLESKLQKLLVSYDESLNGLLPLNESSGPDLDSKDLPSILMRLGELQQNACEKIVQLIEEKRGLVYERDTAQVSATAVESEISLMKRRFEHDIQNMVDKLGVSNTVIQKLQLDIEGIANKLKVSSEVEEQYVQQQTGLLSDLDRLEVELQELTSKNRDLGCEILGLETLTNELERSEMTAAELAKENQALMASLQGKSEEAVNLASELKYLRESFQSLHDDNQSLIVALQDKEEKSSQLASELNSLKDSLQLLHGENQCLRTSSHDKTEEAAKLASELNILKENVRFLKDENEVLLARSKEKMEESSNLALELNNLKGNLQSLHEENRTLVDKLEDSTKLELEVKRLKESLGSLYNEKEALMVSSRDRNMESDALASEVNGMKESLQCLNDENKALMASAQAKSEESDKLASELNSLKECLESLRDENQALMVSSQDKSREPSQLASELTVLKKELQLLHNELQNERSLRAGLESNISDITSQLNEKQSQLLQLDQHESEMARLKQLLSDLESEKSTVCHRLLRYEECLENARRESSSVSAIQTQLSEVQELLISEDVAFIYLKTQYEGMLLELLQQRNSANFHLAELHKKNTEVENKLSCSLDNEAKYIEKNESLLADIGSLRSQLEDSVAENKLLMESSRVLRAELEECKDNAQKVCCIYSEDNTQHVLELETLKQMLASFEEEVDNLMLSKVELDVIVLLLKDKFEEHRAQIILLEGYHDELEMMQKQSIELKQKLSEQILKTEEYRNLSIRLKELKDKADTECIQARDRRQSDGPPAAMQESLRIAFIKEQYETRLQELKQQLSISKKHSEEMLWKLQDAIDDIENRKKSEASHLKKNEELGMKILELEAELQSLLSEKREKMNAYDLMKAEMECSLISLECCKEEKQKLEASLQDCVEEKSKMQLELNQIKELLESSKSDIVSCTGLTGDSSPKYLERDICSNKVGGEECPSAVSVDEADHKMMPMSIQPEQGALVSSSVNGLGSSILINEQKLLDGDVKHLAIINDHFRAESLKSSMDHLSNELERMKNENSTLLQDDNNFNQKFPGLQRELMQLEEANEELGRMFPLFSQFSGSGNALERVLALEIELAEALQAKKRASIHFQSSFLKQHSDEEAVFKSFRDINELIKDMLEMKGRYAAVETELKEMHDRYSQLSLQFAEVEGERQKLMMTLKNVRSSKKAIHLIRSSSASLEDHPS
ncbi:hypothetical protein Tsubulata_030986 [Turnera subulata]|uniref:C2 NT-type domain-containing protein n=1 Tax=Turnera subulata TaxID=218843 RepID=A0A9Q0G0N4_9ROSI|nr:hypothetical protein Tsubulata_030986 [Turnera subulata]